MKRTIIAIALLFLLCSCDSIPQSWNWGLRPRPISGTRNFPETDTEYGKGFKDGCGSAFDAVSKGLLSDIHVRKFDYKRMQKSPDYNRGWFDGLEQCTYIMDWNVT